MKMNKRKIVKSLVLGVAGLFSYRMYNHINPKIGAKVDNPYLRDVICYMATGSIVAIAYTINAIIDSVPYTSKIEAEKSETTE